MDNEKASEDDNSKRDRYPYTLEHNGLLYDCHLQPVVFKQTENHGKISVSIPAEQVTSELYEIVKGGEYVVNINTADSRYEVDSAEVDYTRRGDSMTFQFRGELHEFSVYARD
jgi:hypothetical protein